MKTIKQIIEDRMEDKDDDIVFFSDESIPIECTEIESIYFNGKDVGEYRYGIDKENKIYLESIYIQPSYRRKGLGTKIIEELFKIGNTIILSPVEESKSFFKKFKNTYNHKEGFMYLTK